MFSYRVLPVDSYPEDYTWSLESVDRDAPPPIIISPVVSNTGALVSTDNSAASYMVPEPFPVEDMSVYHATDMSPSRQPCHHYNSASDLRLYTDTTGGDPNSDTDYYRPVYEYELPLALESMVR